MSQQAVSKIQAEIDTVFRAVVEALGESFSAEDLLSFIRAYRKRPLYFKVFPTPSEWNNLEWMGACCAAADQDMLLVRDGRGDILFYSTLGHESGHLLSNHVQTIHYRVEHLLHHPEELLQHVHLNEYHGPKDEKELVAEELGILFTECLAKHAFGIPEVIRQFYGDDEA